MSISPEYLRCPECGYVSSDLDLTRTAEPCPNCRSVGFRRLFPDASRFRYANMATSFYSSGQKRISESRERLRKAIKEKTEKEFTSAHLVKTVKKVALAYQKTPNPQDTEQAVLDVIEKELQISEREAKSIEVLLFRHNDTTEEHAASVIIAMSFLESLMNDLLCTLITNQGYSKTKAEQKLRNYRSWESKKDVFCLITGVCLEDAISGGQNVDFLSKWNSIRNLRNRFIHNAAHRIGPKAAEDANQLVVAAPTVFADLNNRFALKNKNRSNQPASL